MLSKLLSTCPEEHLQSNVSERKSWKLKDFWINFEVFGTMAEKNFSGLAKRQKMFREELIEKRFQKRKIIFFSTLSGFWLWVKKIDRRAEHANYVSLENFWGSFLRKPIKSFTPLWFLIPKIRSRKFYLYVVTTAIRASRGIFWIKVFFLRKFMFVHLFWRLSNFFCLLTKNQGVKETTYQDRKKIGGKIFSKNRFFNHLRTSSRKVWTSKQKKLAELSKLVSKCSKEQF